MEPAVDLRWSRWSSFVWLGGGDHMKHPSSTLRPISDHLRNLVREKFSYELENKFKKDLKTF